METVSFTERHIIFFSRQGVPGLCGVDWISIKCAEKTDFFFLFNPLGAM